MAYPLGQNAGAPLGALCFFGGLMAIPDYETLMLPLLLRLSDGCERVLKDVQQERVDEFHLTAKEWMDAVLSRC